MGRGMPSRLAGAAVLVFVLAACDAVCGPIPAAGGTSVQSKANLGCVDVAAPHHAYVVVEHASGAWLDRCVGFAPGYIDAPTLLNRAGIVYAAPRTLVCAVDGEPDSNAACDPGASWHWALFVAGGRAWSAKRPGDFMLLHVGDGQALGLRYVISAEPSPAPPPLPHELGG
jgi:hypothetical protein